MSEAGSYCLVLREGERLRAWQKRGCRELCFPKGWMLWGWMLGGWMLGGWRIQVRPLSAGGGQLCREDAPRCRRDFVGFGLLCFSLRWLPEQNELLQQENPPTYSWMDGGFLARIATRAMRMSSPRL